jgi:acetyl-CoA acetyltransferase
MLNCVKQCVLQYGRKGEGVSEHGGGQISIVGTGTTNFALEVPGRSVWALGLEAISLAVADAGLEVKDIDGLVVTPTGRFRDPRVGYSMGEHLGIYMRKLSVNNEGGSGSVGFSLDIAQWALTEGRCNYVVLVDAGKWSDFSSDSRPTSFQEWALAGDSRPQQNLRLLHQTQDEVWGGTWLSQYALIAQRHQYEFGTSDEHLAAVAVAARHNAALNPDAVFRTPITIADVLNSPSISSPLRRLMCSMVNDGAAAIVLTTNKRAKHSHNRPVHILGSGSGFAGRTLTKSAGGDSSGRFDMLHTIGKLAADQAFDAAGINRSDVDVAGWSDPCAIWTIIALEDYGFCSKGEGGPFIGDGARIQIGGELPVNTNGGWLSGTFASASQGTLVEVVRQLEGNCGDRQVDNARIGFFGSGGGAISNHSVAILGRG